MAVFAMRGYSFFKTTQEVGADGGLARLRLMTRQDGPGTSPSPKSDFHADKGQDLRKRGDCGKTHDSFSDSYVIKLLLSPVAPGDTLLRLRS